MSNRERLSRTLHWPRYIEALDDTLRFCESSERNFGKIEASYKIMKDGVVAGVVSFNAIDHANKIAEIGYWIDRCHEGSGIVSMSVRAMIEAYARAGRLRRFVIKCSTRNAASRAVAERLGFDCEGMIAAAEKIGEEYHDQYLYSRIIGPESLMDSESVDFPVREARS